MSEPLYLTVSEVAAQLRCHPTTVRRFIKAGRIEAVRLGHEWRILPAALTPAALRGRQ